MAKESSKNMTDFNQILIQKYSFVFISMLTLTEIWTVL